MGVLTPIPEDDKVVGLHGPVSAAVCPNAQVVALLEHTLAEARRGEIDGIAIAIGRPNGAVSSKFEFGTASFRLFGALALLDRDIKDAVARSSTDDTAPKDDAG